MFRVRLLLYLLSAITMIVLPSLGFAADQPANASVTWNVAATFDMDQKFTEDHPSTAKTVDVAGVEKTSEIKRSTEIVEQPRPVHVSHEQKFDFILDSIENKPRYSTKSRDTSFVQAGAPTADSVTSTPRNIVMVIAEPSEDREDFWKNVKALRSNGVDGSLQSSDSIQGTRFSLDSPLLSGSKTRRHNCELALRSNIAALLLWARDVKGMTIGTLTSANFTIPSLFGYEESFGPSKDFEELDENNMRSEIRKVKPDAGSDWRAIDSTRPSYKDPSASLKFSREDDATRTDDDFWKAFNMLSAVRRVLFFSLLEALGDNASEANSSPSRKSAHLPRSNLLDTVEELKSVENEKGFVLVASISSSELAYVLDLLQGDLSEDTLVVVTGCCPHDAKPVRFSAHGPSARKLRDAKTLWEVPTVIKNIIANGCSNSKCKNRPRDIFRSLIPSTRIAPSKVAIFKRSAEETTEKLDDDKKIDASNKEEVKKVADSNAKESTIRVNKDAKPKADESNSGSMKMAEKCTAIFGTVFSMIIAFSLAP